jgi:hypothetical protein
MKKWLAIFLLIACAARGQNVVGPLQAQNNLKEIAANGSGAQQAAQVNLGLGATPGPFCPLTGCAYTGPVNFTGLFKIAGVTQVFPGSGLLAGLGDNQAFTGINTFNRGEIVPSSRYDATAFGSCTWDATHDVGPCINAAITAANASAGGVGTIIIPSGIYGLGTTITMGVTGTHLQGSGVGGPHDNAFGPFLSATRLVALAGLTGGTMLDVEPASTHSIYSMDVTGIVFDCASLANVCAKFEQVSNSIINIGVGEARSINAWFTTEPVAFGDGPGNQNNDIWVWSRNTSATYSPTGLLIDGSAGSNWNTSFNRFHQIWVWYAKGDGVVFGWGDNNLVYSIEAFPDGVNHGGTPMVFANTAYVDKAGNAVHGSSVGTRVLKTESSGIVAGYQSGSTITAGANSGTAAVTTIPLTTNGTSAYPGAVLNFASTTGVVPGMVAACGGWNCGVAPNTPVLSSSSASVTLTQAVEGGVANGANFLFGYGITTSAAWGAYVMTAVDGTHWSLTTVPSGGHSQTNIAVANGAISFTDVVIPLSGTPVPGDTFTIVVPFPAEDTLLEGFDGGIQLQGPGTNHIPPPMVEAGGTYFLMGTTNPFPQMIGGNGDITVQPLNGVTHNTNLGGFGGVVGGAYSSNFGGLNNLSNGFGSMTRGQNNTASAVDDVAEGSSNSSTGSYSRTEGFNSTDRARFGISCYATGDLAALGDAQTCFTVLHGTGASGSAIHLTSDGLVASGINCVNIPNNTAYAITVTLMAFDHTTVTKNETWLNWGGLLTRGANAASTAVTMQTTPTPLTNGSLSGSAVSVTADTTNGCLTTTFTPPTANTDTWNAVARVVTVEVQ